MAVNLKNDYNTIADKKILEALIKHNNEKNIGYGEDIHSKELNEMVNSILDKNVDTYVLAGGTITNVIGLNQMLKSPYEAVMAVKSAHINVHETGAIEATGHKVIYLDNISGKVDINKIEDTYKMYTDNHMVLPKALYISNATELGETYTIDELKEIYNITRKLNIYLFIDGARLPEALVSGGYSLKDISNYCDMFYLGGTKLGLPFGEMLIIVNDSLKNNFKYMLKNRLGLFAKGFVGAIMFKEYLKDDYYLSLAKQEKDMADMLREALGKYIIYKNETNQVFLKVKTSLINELNKYILFEVWEDLGEMSVIRLVTSYATTKDEIYEAIKAFKEVGM